MNNIEDPHVQLQEKLRQRRKEHRYRTLNTIDEIQSSRFLKIDGVEYVNFSSNDYLNLSNHPYLKEKSREFVENYGTGSSSSRLITGTLDIHTNLENRLAKLYQKERALLFSTGFQANSTILPAITEKKDVLIVDELCHNSILTGCMASRARFYRYRHNDINHLKTFLERNYAEEDCNLWIVTESLFSMDGDRVPLDKILKLASAYNAKLYVDDAHAFGVCGRDGLGYGADYPSIDILISTFGKAGGSFGAFVASSNTVIESLINFCNGFIYTTALPPSVTGAIEAALDLIPGMSSEREHLNHLNSYLHSGIKNLGFKTSAEPSHIVPIILGAEEEVLNREENLQKNGILTTAIRPPTVPNKSCRFRISLTAAHKESDCNKLLDAIRV